MSNFCNISNLIFRYAGHSLQYLMSKYLIVYPYTFLHLYARFLVLYNWTNYSTSISPFPSPCHFFQERQEKERMMVRLRSMRFSRSSSSKLRNGNKATPQTEKDCRSNSETKWEIRPGGMLVQKREISNQISGDGMITIIVSTVSESHDISIEATSTFGNLPHPFLILTPNYYIFFC